MIQESDELELVILLIKRGNVKITKKVYDTTLHEGDQILLFGTKKVISKTFNHDIKRMEEKLKKLQPPLMKRRIKQRIGCHLPPFSSVFGSQSPKLFLS